MSTRAVFTVCCWIVAGSGCAPGGGAQLPPAAAAEPARAARAPSGAEVPEPARSSGAVRLSGGEAHRWLIAGVGCWLGGLWSDALAASDEDRSAAATRRCHALVERLYGSDDADRYERVRSLESLAVSELGDKLDAVAATDAIDADRTSSLQKLLHGAADAARETMFARRASDKLKADILAGRAEQTRASAEAAAGAALAETHALEALLALDAGDLTHEARAIGVLLAMDRMGAARGLPKRLKVIALQRQFLVLFGAAPPSADTSKPLKGGVWLAYLTLVAKAAGHPVPEAIKPLPSREQLAWGGAVMGLADKLEAEAPLLSGETDLKSVAVAVIERLRNAYRASQAATVEPASDAAGLELEDEGFP